MHMTCIYTFYILNTQIAFQTIISLYFHSFTFFYRRVIWVFQVKFLYIQVHIPESNRSVNCKEMIVRRTNILN